MDIVTFLIKIDKKKVTHLRIKRALVGWVLGVWCLWEQRDLVVVNPSQA